MHLQRSEADNDGLQRTRRELRASGVKETAAELRTGIHHRGYLPHVKREGALYFVTFRLADSLPKEVLMEMVVRKAERLRGWKEDVNGKGGRAAFEEEVARDFQREVERYLDKGAGACYLRRDDVAEVVANALRHFHNERYVLDDWVVMPNHVHAVVLPLGENLLGGILKSWKQFTSRRAKEVLKLGDGPFWQPESYDRWIRDEEEKARVRKYVRNNPVAAGLCGKAEDWRWSSAGWRDV
jgi:REP element-mobilizing transposase RayT